MAKPDIQVLVVNLLRKAKDRGELTTLSRRSKISYRYILALIQGDIADPSFRRLSHLARFVGVRIVCEYQPEETT